MKRLIACEKCGGIVRVIEGTVTDGRWCQCPQGSTPESAGEKTVAISSLCSAHRERYGHPECPLCFPSGEKDPQPATTVQGQKELLPCPFCGGKATTHKQPSSLNTFVKFVTTCDSENCIASTTDRYNDKQSCIKAWNTRAPSVPSGNEEHKQDLG
jgi:hypothetical protein